MKKTIVFTMLVMAALVLSACSSGGTCAPEEQSILLISTSPPDANAQADGVDAVRLTITGRDENCLPLKDTQVQLNLTNPSPAEVGEFVENGGKSLTVTLGQFGAQARVRSRHVGTVRVEAFCQEHNLTALPVTLTFREPEVTGQCAVEVDPEPKAIEADGVSTSTITATLRADNGGPMPNGTQVHFTTTRGKFNESNTTEYNATSQNSIAIATLRSEQLSGDNTATATVTATFNCNDGKSHSGNNEVVFGHLDKPRVDLHSDTDSVLADGMDSATLTADVYRAGGERVGAGVQVDFFVANGPGYFSENNETLYSGVTDATGSAKATFVGGSQQGSATIQANIFLDNQNAFDEVTINIRALGAVQFVSATPTKLGLKGSGRNESSDVVFKVIDNLNQPFPDVLVEFSISPAPGVTLGDTSKRSDENGLVTTKVYSGLQPGTVEVTATARVGAVTLSATSPSISIVGAKPSARNFTFSCQQPLNVGGFIVNNAQIHCTVMLADRFNNPVGFATNVNFTAEAGSIDGTAVTSEQAATLGMATITARTADPRPWDVEPLPDEPVVRINREPPTSDKICRNNTDCRQATPPATDAQPHLAEICVNPGQIGSYCEHSNNPRDGLVTLMAYTTGEESFTDNNGNGQYDTGIDTFTDSDDISEPFVDANDNGQWDPGERFIDLNGDGFTPKNGVWDSSITIWKEYRVLWTGHAEITAPSNASCTANPRNRYSILCSTRSPYDGFTIAKDERLDFIWEVKDFNLNPINETLSVDVDITGKGTMEFSDPDLAFNAPDEMGNCPAWWDAGGGFSGIFTIKGNNSGLVSEPGAITLRISYKRTPGDNITTQKTITLNGTFTPP